MRCAVVLIAACVAAAAGAQVLLPPAAGDGGAPIPSAPTGPAFNAPRSAASPASAASAAALAPTVSALAPGTYNSMDVEGPVIRSFAPDVPRPELCLTACQQEAACAAYSFVRAGGYNPGDPAMCYLKSRVDRATPNVRVLSGVLR